MVPLYPKEKCALFRPHEETETRGRACQRRVVLTTGPGEALVWGGAVKFVVDVGLECRKVTVTARVRQTAAGC